ncbi:phage tail tape measure protein, TP901 family [Paenibacillus sp. FSL R7-269]|uniref:phage tail tape measure protein n=1 Tax=Paenibacillus sp. FSL R7-269 TaxID=1226755 RepID=UPI0003E22C8D|nr:phage tail tape measure protein [Paenibacillus sp. FSL R7-269]ETT45218.1 phage tail tape measure protein, TP901 family [Paenibacillus sp. FSL R7-269]
MAGGIIGSLMYAVGFKFNSGGLDEADSKVGILTKSVIGLGAAGGAALIGIGSAALAASSDFENAMSNVQMTTSQTTEQMEATREVAKNLYNQNFGEDWDDLGGSIAAVAKATGLTGDALESASREAMLYAGQFDGDVTESIAGVSVAMKNFGVTSTEAFNLLTQGQGRGVDTLGDMLDSVNEYSQAFASMGFTMEDTMGYFDNGMKAGARNTDLLGDAMNEFSILSIEAGGTAETSFQALGLDANKMMKTFSNGGPAAKSAFKDIVSMISDIQDPVQQNTVGIGLFGTMFEELGVKAFSALDDVNTSFDQSKDSAANLNNGFTSIGESMQYFKRHIETGILIPIGQKLLPYLSMFGAWIASHQPQIAAFGDLIGTYLGIAIEKVSGWVQALIPYLQDFGAQAAALWPDIQNIAAQIYDVGRAIVEWEPFIPIISGIAAILLTYKTTMVAVATATKIAGVATKVWSGITKAFTAVQTAFNAVMAMNPIALVVLALVGLGVALTVAYKRSDKFRAFIDGMWAGIKTATMVILNFFKVTVPKYFMIAFNFVTNFIKKWGITILAVIGGPITMIALLVYKNWDKIKAVTIAVFTAVWNWLKSAWDWMKTTVSSGATAIWNVVTGVWNNIKAVTVGIFSGVWNWLVTLWDNVVGTVTGAGSRIFGAVSGAWNNVKTGISTAMEAVKTTMSNAWGFIVGAVSGVGDSIKTKLTGAWDGVKSTFINAINWIIGKYNSMIGKLNSVSIKNPFTGEEIVGINIKPIAPIDGSHANGLSNVPWDGYIAELHKDERVLTADENEKYSRYTPETAPARTSSNQKINITAPSITITVQGNADTKTAQQIGSIVDQKLQDFLESASRIMGVEISGAN